MNSKKELLDLANQAYVDSVDTRQQLLDLANQAYRQGNPIMGDAEYDALEKEAGLENANEVGEKHSPEMTIRHPYIMGSLSKVQVHADKEGKIDWSSIYKNIISYVGEGKAIIATPKYDGCSFEAYFKNGECVSVSTRGDSKWGRDISRHIYNKIPDALRHLSYDEYTLRGEILVNKEIFEKRWSSQYVNTRAFVAGVTGQDYDANDYELLQKLNDLSIIIYDFRVFDGQWIYKNWVSLLETYENCSSVFPDVYTIQGPVSEDLIEFLYDMFDKYRKESSWSLDGFVLKPINILQDSISLRPKDCVAVKFLPMTVETEVENITWELGKTGEYFPIVWYKPVKMDGKTCVKASGHNWGTLVEKGISIGAKVTISMAGDIIPYIYKINSPVFHGDINIPDDTYTYMCHLMKKMSSDEKRIEEFRNSCRTLDVPGLGDAQIQKIIDGIKEECKPDEFFGIEAKEFPWTVFALNANDFSRLIGGKAGEKIGKAYQDIISNISLETIIESLNIRFCGKTLSKEIAKYITGQSHDFGNMAQDGWSWSLDDTSDEFMKLNEAMSFVGKDIAYFTTIAEQTKAANTSSANKTFIIMTGEPNGYNTKADFLKAHPEYEETSSWKKVQIVFTNSLDSNTSKMKKARQHNIEIRVY